MSKAIAYAREELNRYLKLLGIQADISVGLFEELGIAMQVEDPVFDDAIAISVQDKKGYAAGINERSVLHAVYRLLKEWGIYWVRPGKNGTFIPEKGDPVDVQILEKPDKRYRIMCIEGAVSLENVLDMIEWLPKVGYNGYYIQFSNPYEFFERWYNHRGNPIRKPEGIAPETTAEYRKVMVKEIKKRGLMLFAMGHGWNCIPFGIPDNGWYALDPEEIPESYKKICAMLNGRREVFNNAPLQGQLCYSDPYVKEKMVNGVVQYIKENPEADVVFFWLGDYFNNTCECPACTKLHFSDYMVQMMNEITDKLVAEGVKTKVAFSHGYNKTNPPAATKILNQENLLMDFAPITRNYSESMPDTFRITELPEYEVNNYMWDPSIDKLLAGMYAWKKEYQGDVVDFDYHLMWDHVFDAGGEGLAKVLQQDIKNFDALGIRGYISCQLQRNAFPTSIVMTAMAQVLWDQDTDFEKMKRELYAASFGEDAAEALCAYFEGLSNAFRIGEIRGFDQVDPEEFISRMESAMKAMEAFAVVVDAHLDVKNECHRESWKNLKAHKEIYMLMAQTVIAYVQGNTEDFEKLKKQTLKTAWEQEENIQAVFDGWNFEQRVSGQLGNTQFVPV